MAMTSEQWLTAVKAGMGGIVTTFHDTLLTQKINAVKTYMTGAGVIDALIEDPLGIEVVTLGVRDLWNLSPGTVTFSGAFHVCIAQLKARSIPDDTEV